MSAAQAEPDEEGTYRLIMPITVVKSAGGKYDDESFVAGANFGAIDQELKILSVFGAYPRPHFIPNDMVQQIDLLAMKHGFITASEPSEENPEEWSRVDFGYPGDHLE